MFNRTLIQRRGAIDRTNSTSTSDKIVVASVLALALVTIGCWTYVLDAQWRVEHLNMQPLPSLAAALKAGHDAEAAESLATGSATSAVPRP